MESIFDEPTKHKFLGETPELGCQFCGYLESKHNKNFSETELINTPDPRGNGPVEDPGAMRNGQPNIIDYSNQEPLLFGLGQNSSHDYPGKIVINNESRYVDRAVKHDETKSTAETGKSQPLNDITQPTIPTGSPQPVVIPPEETNHNMHGLNFNNKIKWNESITIIPPEATRKTNEQVIKENQYMAERGDLKEDIPLSQAFSDIGNNPHIEVMPTVDPNEEGLHNTGKDLSRTGPEGNVPYDNNNSVNYQGTGDVKINIPTPYYGHDAKKIYDISGVVPEYQEDIRIVISDPLGDEKFLPEIKIDIAGHFEPGKEPNKKLEKNDLKNNPGRKDPGTHTNTIKAGEKGIAELIPISDIWKDAKEFSFSESIIQDESTTSVDRGFIHPSSWIGEVTYSPSSQKMQVQMNGKSYTHCGVTDRDFDAFQGSPSKGAHWNRIFKNNMQCVQGLSEALTIYKHKQPDEFDWINADEIENMKVHSKKHGKGRFILAVVSGESVTDHRPEGVESMRRRWTKKEMSQNIRTGKGKLIDINHQFPKIDPHSGGIYDANWNEKTEKGEMMIWETDQVILDAIRNNIIEAVSINTGKPRRIDTNCNDGECFIEPVGTILGEENGVALAYVVTANEGFDYHGQHIDPLPPGMKFTKIYLVE